jgi:hypothetical protein
MSLFGRLFQGWSSSEKDLELRRRALERWAEAGPETDGGEDVFVVSQHAATDYERTLWRKKLQRILDDLPDSKSEWPDFAPDGDVLGLGDAWIHDRMVEEFTLLIRRVIADGVVTDAEHRKLDMARDLIGLSDSQAEAIFQQAIEEAEAFFGKSVEGA